MEKLVVEIQAGCSASRAKTIVKSINGSSLSTKEKKLSLDALKGAIERGAVDLLSIVLSSSFCHPEQKEQLRLEFPALIYHAAFSCPTPLITPVICKMISMSPFCDISEAMQTLNEEGFSALHLAAMEGQVQTVKVLLKLGADPKQQSRDGNTALTFAIACNHCKLWEFLLPFSDVNSKDKDGDSPLMFAAWQKECYLVQLLLDAGADVNASSFNDSTALWNAVFRSDPDTVLLLLGANADMNVCCEGTHLFHDDILNDDEGGDKLRKIYHGTQRSLLWVTIDKAGSVLSRQKAITVLGMLLENGYDLTQDKWIGELQYKSIDNTNIPSSLMRNIDLQNLLLFLYQKPPYLRDLCRSHLRALHRKHYPNMSFSCWVSNLGISHQTVQFLTLSYLKI